MSVNAPIPSFIRRESKKSKQVALALQEQWPKFGIQSPLAEPLDVDLLFGRQAPLVVELGFGHGTSLSLMAAAMRDKNFLGVEVYQTGIGKLLNQILERKLDNIRIYQGDAWPFLVNHIANHSISQLNLFFPDPWPKARHHKRRLVREAFIDILESKLVPGGIFHMATDWEHYYEAVSELFAQRANFVCLTPGALSLQRPAERPQTKFELRGLKLGHTIHDLIFQLKV